MFISKLAVPRRYRRLLVPLVAALVAGAVVAGVSLATDSTSSSKTVGQAVTPGLALQLSLIHI